MHKNRQSTQYRQTGNFIIMRKSSERRSWWAVRWLDARIWTFFMKWCHTHFWHSKGGSIYEKPKLSQLKKFAKCRKWEEKLADFIIILTTLQVTAVADYCTKTRTWGGSCVQDALNLCNLDCFGRLVRRSWSSFFGIWSHALQTRNCTMTPDMTRLSWMYCNEPSETEQLLQNSCTR